MKLSSLHCAVLVSAIIIFSGIFGQGFAIQLEAGISPSKNAADATFTGDRIITLRYPADSTLAQMLAGNKDSISFTLDTSDSSNGMTAVLDKINEYLLSQKQSLVEFANATLEYRATVNGGPTTATISYQVELHPAITNLVTESNGTSSSLLDIDWRGMALEEPLIVNTQEYGQIDVNHPMSGLEKLVPEVASKIQNTTLAEVFNTPILDFEEFGVSMNNWHFLFDATGAQAGAAGYGFSLSEGDSEIVSIYSLGESSFREGTHTVKETSASSEIDGVTVSANGLTAPPSGQIQIGGFSQIQPGGSAGTEHLLVSADAPQGVATSSGSFPIQVLLIFGAMMGGVAVLVLLKARK
ncbi:hypothetical protein [Candidatus Nitrosocosmicus franklandus]|uniref:Uncharacterized protein n=1 Tax=Candidatus Nitrosocosmicus franklandianus TaxID=1798806 RepID=A0A484IER6_9ARCH|nr:hypothetical protein [Candidatus Nitrosocosmicus franklandus]VFJ14639.1 conserved protein of unknown function [Candidatus Nitrosocosmicus franklandus]